MRYALRTEQKELTSLLHALAQPREARAIVRILQLVSTVDSELDQRETALLNSVARPLGVSVEDLAAQPEAENASVADVREAFLDYLALKPVGHQVGKAYDLVRFMARADKHISNEEYLILDELALVVQDYLSAESTRVRSFEVLLVPQSEAQKHQINSMLPHAELVPKAGGYAYVAGSFYSQAFATEVCKQYREKGFFCAVEPQH